MAVYKRGEKWAVRVDLGRVGGKRPRRSYGLFRTKKLAEAKEREVLQELSAGIDLQSQSLTVAQILARYATNCEARNIGLKSIERYRELAEKQIIPYIGSVTLTNLRKSHIVELVETLATRGNVRTKGPLAPKTVRLAVSLLRTSLDWAVHMEILTRNVAVGVRLPKVRRREAKAIEGDEAQRLLAAAASEGWLWDRFFTIALTVGARRGELAALRWSDIDWDAGTVTIQRAYSRTKGLGTYIKQTKTDHVRTVRLSPMAIAALRRQRAAQAAEKLKNRPDYHDEDLVFANAIGERINLVTITNAFNRIAKKAKISTTRLHDLRHTFASWLLASGENVETVRDALGHSTSYTTLTVYGHVIKKANAASVSVIDERLEAK